MFVVEHRYEGEREFVVCEDLEILGNHVKEVMEHAVYTELVIKRASEPPCK
jgi:hypothetical protein